MRLIFSLLISRSLFQFNFCRNCKHALIFFLSLCAFLEGRWKELLGCFHRKALFIYPRNILNFFLHEYRSSFFNENIFKCQLTSLFLTVSFDNLDTFIFELQRFNLISESVFGGLKNLCLNNKGFFCCKFVVGENREIGAVCVWVALRMKYAQFIIFCCICFLLFGLDLIQITKQ